MPDAAFRVQLVQLIRGGQAHISFDDAITGFPVENAGVRPAASPHSAWQLLEHMRIALEDITRFSGVFDEELRISGGTAPPKSYKELNWPDDYWPKSVAPSSEEQWAECVSTIKAELDAFVQYLEDPNNDLLRPFPWGDGQNLLREALLIADHNAYHLGQLVLLRRMLE